MNTLYSLNNNIQNFLDRWWAGLSAPWSKSSSKIDTVRIDQTNNAIIWNKGLDKKVYLEIPDSLILSSSIANHDQQYDTEQLISKALPFSAEELYIAIRANQLMAVLKSDLRQFLDQVGPQGEKITGLVFQKGNDQARIELYAKETNSFLINKLSLIGLTLLICLVGTYFWVNQNNQQKINTLEATLSKLNANLNTQSTALPDNPESILELKGATISHIHSSLSAINQVLADDTKVAQLSLQSISDGLNLVLDAQSKSAAEQLSKFDQDSLFADPDFISAISSNADNSAERFRLTSKITAKEVATEGLDNE